MTADFQTRFREELVTAIAQPPRRHRGRLAGVVAISGATLFGAFSLLSPHAARADVRITHDDGRVEVLLTDLESSASVVQRAVTEAGLNVHVEPAPAGPSNVGRFVGHTTTGGDPEELQRVDEAGGAFMGFSIPEDWTGTLTILIGRQATADESYTTFSDAYAQGEPLACSGTLGQPLAAAAGALANLTVTVRGPAGTGSAAELAEVLGTERADWDIAGAFALSATELRVSISPTPVDPGKRSC